MPVRSYYAAPVDVFLGESSEYILGVLASHHQHALEEPQRRAWLEQIGILRHALSSIVAGELFLEFFIPRMGKRADAVLITANRVFILEFKIGAASYERSAFDQVEDYALDLKNFHEGSHSAAILPILVASESPQAQLSLASFAEDLVAKPIATNGEALGDQIHILCEAHDCPPLDLELWKSLGYKPTPTIIEAAQVLYETHSVTDISRSDAGENLRETSASVSAVIDRARRERHKAICFVTGVPGSGKTLAGLNLATRRSEEHHDEHAVFLSGNGPLVDVLREALARDKVQRTRVPRKTAEREVRSFIQNIHHFRDDNLVGPEPPIEKVVIFDEAQRAWSREQTASFMKRKKALPDFDMSEPEFLISVMDRHIDWCTVVCLIGGGQEINTGEAGISEWIRALESRFPHWQAYISPRITTAEYGVAETLEHFLRSPRAHSDEHLHLAVSMRSFRAESLSAFVAQMLDNQPEAARLAYEAICKSYPIYLTRSLHDARNWLRERTRGTERPGLVASSGALRLRPEGVFMKAKVDPPNWFLNPREDIRSSHFLEEVASEFDVQGLELDWVGVAWDADLHYADGRWHHQSFKGTRWMRVRDEGRQSYLKNAYRVLLTRARQGMVIYIPAGESEDITRRPSWYDDTFDYLRSCGLPELPAE